jgi:SNF2 family DNA or RNA helicase
MAWAAVDPDGPKLAIGAAKAEHSLCLQIPGCNLGKDGIWRVPLSWPAYVCFRTVWSSQPVTETQGLQQWAARQWEEVQYRYQMRGTIDDSAAPQAIRDSLRELEAGQGAAVYDTALSQEEIEAHYRLHLTPPQRGAAAWLATFGRVVLEDPTGNGKTPPIIRALQLLHADGKGCPALVIAPGAALYPWRDKLNAWAPELEVVVVTGTAGKRKKALTDRLMPADVYLIAWPNVRLHSRLAPYPAQRAVCCPEHGGVDPKITPARCEVHEKELNGIDFQVVVADEAHRMGDARSKQTRAVWYLAHRAPVFWPVTGTLDGISAVWSVFHGIDPRAFPAKSRFLDLFAIKEHAWHGGVEVLGLRPDTEPTFQSIVQPWIRRVPKPVARSYAPGGYQEPLEPEFRYPEMTPAQARPYAQLRKEFLAELDGQPDLVAGNYGVRFSRLVQLASSAVEVLDGEDQDGFTKPVVELALPSSKVADLMEFLGDNPGQLVVAANSPRLIALAERKLNEAKITNCKIVGGMSPEQKYNANMWFQNGDCRVIFIQPMAGGESIDLTATNVIYMMQPSPSYRQREQLTGRVDRFGQRYALRVVHALTPGTVEKRLYQLGCDKAERAAEIERDPDLLRWLVAGDE